MIDGYDACPNCGHHTPGVPTAPPVVPITGSRIWICPNCEHTIRIRRDYSVPKIITVFDKPLPDPGPIIMTAPPEPPPPINPRRYYSRQTK